MSGGIQESFKEKAICVLSQESQTGNNEVEKINHGGGEEGDIIT